MLLTLALLGSAVLAFPTSSDTPLELVRFDVDERAWSRGILKLSSAPFTLPKTQALAQLKSSTAARIDNSTQQPFIIDFHCGVKNTTLCQRAQQGFESACTRIASVLSINTPITVKANFSSFCGTNSSATSTACDLRNTLGQASPASYFSAAPLDVKNAWFYYPQALVKQLKHEYTLKYGTYDIYAEFNADFNFWFKDSKIPITSDQTDFEFVVAHELTHGLGFVTSYTQWSSVFSPLTSSSSYIAPLINFDGTTINNAKVSNWQPLNIFDRYIGERANSNPILDMARNIVNYQPANQSLIGFIKGFEKSGSPFLAAQNVFKLFTSGSKAVQFQPNSNANTIHSSLKPVLHTNTNLFLSGSSVVHLDYDTYLSSADFLMIPAVQNLTGKSLDDIIIKNTNNGTSSPLSIYGPSTLAILSSMGWPTRATPNPQTIVINPRPLTSQPFYASNADTMRSTHWWLTCIVFIVIIESI